MGLVLNVHSADWFMLCTKSSDNRGPKSTHPALCCQGVGRATYIWPARCWHCSHRGLHRSLQEHAQLVLQTQIEEQTAASRVVINGSCPQGSASHVRVCCCTQSQRPAAWAARLARGCGADLRAGRRQAVLSAAVSTKAQEDLTRSPRVMRMLSSRNTTSKRAERTPLGACQSWMAGTWGGGA